MYTKPYIGRDNSDNLTHYGVKGMRWGVRRYANKDGTLTPAGKRRLSGLDKSQKYDETGKRRSAKSIAKTLVKDDKRNYKAYAKLSRPERQKAAKKMSKFDKDDLLNGANEHGKTVGSMLGVVGGTIGAIKMTRVLNDLYPKVEAGKKFVEGSGRKRKS